MQGLFMCLSPSPILKIWDLFFPGYGFYCAGGDVEEGDRQYLF